MAWATMLEKASHLSPRSLIRKDMSNTTFKHYVAPFKDVSGNMWALLIAYPDTEETKSYPKVKEVRLGVPAVTLTTESEDALAPVVKGRLAFSLLEERADQRYRHLVQAPEGDVSVVLMYLGDEKLPANGTLSDQWMQACIDRFDPTTSAGNVFGAALLILRATKSQPTKTRGILSASRLMTSGDWQEYPSPAGRLSHRYECRRRCHSRIFFESFCTWVSRDGRTSATAFRMDQGGCFLACVRMWFLRCQGMMPRMKS